MYTRLEHKTEETEERLFNHDMVNVTKTETVFNKDGMVIEKRYLNKPLYVVLRHDKTFLSRKYITKVTKSRPVLENVKTDGVFTSKCYYVCKMNGKYINSFCGNRDFYTYKKCKRYKDDCDIMDRLIKSNEILRRSFFSFYFMGLDKKYKNEEIYSVDFFLNDDFEGGVTYTKKEKEKLLLQKQEALNGVLAELELITTQIKKLQEELYVERKI